MPRNESVAEGAPEEFRATFLKFCDLAAAELCKPMEPFRVYDRSYAETATHHMPAFEDAHAVRALAVAFDLTGEPKYLEACRRWADWAVEHQARMIPPGAYYMNHSRAPGEDRGQWNAADSGTVAGLAGRRLAAVFQEDRLCEQLTAVGNVRLVLHGKAEAAVVRGELAAVGLGDDDVGKPVSQLSGGQRRRVAIVRALLADADFVCLDEPFKGLDEATKDRVIDYVRDRTRWRTVLLITHDPVEAEKVGGRIVGL